MCADRLLETIAEPSVRIVPTAGDYFVLDTKASGHISHIIFHEPEEKGKGLTLVPTVDGNILIGPTERELPTSNPQPPNSELRTPNTRKVNQTMGTIVIAVISFTALGLICAIVLSIVSKVMAVPTDERVALVRESLPGANCGACGFTGCDGYAAALIGGGTETNLCTPGGNEVSKRISAILGAESGASVKKRIAVVHCMGDLDTVRGKMEYIGIRTCAAAKQLFGGQGACTFGCIGYGDCEGVCPGAICVKKELACVDMLKCIGCGLCAKTCPNGVISIGDATAAVAVKCKNNEKGAQLKDKCSKGCIGCMKCVKECPSTAIAVNDFLAAIDYDKCTGCGTCAKVCVKGCILSISA
jgi:Na+-translocating ferredoxin:NAD+ oxidoreductase RNF subunit RnfB